MDFEINPQHTQTEIFNTVVRGAVKVLKRKVLPVDKGKITQKLIKQMLQDSPKPYPVGASQFSADNIQAMQEVIYRGALKLGGTHKFLTGRIYYARKLNV